MESSFEERENDTQPACESSAADERYARFELLSAYLDGEVTAAERKQVQEWLDTDPQIQKLYTRLLRLHQGIDSIPIQPAAPPALDLSEQVFQRVDRQRRGKRLVFIGGAAIVAVVVGAINLLFGYDSPVRQVAEGPQAPIGIDSEQLTIALNHPIVEIPAAALLPSEQLNKLNKK
jgi:anti-sigma factor RsiW